MTEVLSISDYHGNGLISFDCGEDDLNVFLREYADQNERKGVSRTYLLVNGDSLIGYFTLSAAEICCESLSDRQKKSLPRYPIPAIRIARFAISKSMQGMGYGDRMMRYALGKCLSVALSVGVVFIMVDAKPKAVPFYERFGFEKAIGTEMTYVIPVSVVAKATGLI